MALPVESQPAPNGLNFLPNQMPNVMPNVDDLFGEDVGVSLSVPASASELRWRIDDLRRRGCSQYVAPHLS